MGLPWAPDWHGSDMPCHCNTWQNSKSPRLPDIRSEASSGGKAHALTRLHVPKAKQFVQALRCPVLIIPVRVDEELQAIGVLQRHGDGGSAVRLLPNIGLVEHQVPGHFQVAFGKSLPKPEQVSGEHV